MGNGNTRISKNTHHLKMTDMDEEEIIPEAIFIFHMGTLFNISLQHTTADFHHPGICNSCPKHSFATKEEAIDCCQQ